MVGGEFYTELIKWHTTVVVGGDSGGGELGK